ncbi:molybdate ABC transporter substrate-binding protein [Tindallia californiensis]|uniref:Molybdate transport system substrate-binding protein n=1 Tax=Tindallia californiensis TaxID=159292 RepID=A0A1H3Q4M4_9FIRM|nr:molybdate ABC transporter substrate-binding protein [Tindallia californiensis]SDZ08492.1 molybdate transport system substrate-binding protein [Tindallia californiensis]
MRKASVLAGIGVVIIFTLLWMGDLKAGGFLSDEKTEDNKLQVLAASSLRFAFEEIGEAFWEKEGIEIVFQYGASGNLAQQIVNGAPVDLYASADRHFMERLVKEEHINEENLRLFCKGILVLAFHQDNSEPVEKLEDLIKPSVQRISIANPEHAPYGKAAKAALETAGLWQELEEKIVYGSTVTQAMQYIETGNVSAAILAKSVIYSEKINFSYIDQSYYRPLDHFIGMVERSEQQKNAQKFLSFLQQEEAEKILLRHGFSMP